MIEDVRSALLRKKYAEKSLVILRKKRYWNKAMQAWLVHELFETSVFMDEDTGT